MSLVVNHNLMAMNAARNLQTIYQRLALSTQRLSSGLRVNSAADDAAGLAVREMMRSDIAAINQGVRNAGDAISLIQTAEGALSVVDEKLTRMKELAQQAATGTYTTTQRAIMDSEYQAMADEIDRIANATDFNGVKLLDGSLTALHSGSGMKIHFGGGNSSAEDYYYISIADMRATESTGLQVGGGATAEILAASTDFTSASVAVASNGSGEWFAYSYDFSGLGTNTLSDFAGYYQLATGTTLSGMVDLLNQGTAARTYLDFSAASGATIANVGSTYITFGNMQVWFVTAAALTAATWGMTNAVGVSLSAIIGVTGASGASGDAIASAVVDAINGAVGGNILARASGGTLMVVYKNAGVAGNGIIVATGTVTNSITFSSATLGSGGSTWAIASVATQTDGNLYLQLTGNDKGEYYDITIQSANTLSSGNLNALDWADSADDFAATEATGSGSWNGADILTQSAAQLALAQIDAAINTKESTRAGLGSLSNRLENTITNLQIQGENLQAAESRISDVDIATEMTEFTKNNILAQAATAMLAQANSLPQLALQLLGGR